MAYRNEIIAKQAELRVLEPLVRQTTQSFLQTIFASTVLFNHDFLDPPKRSGVLTQAQTMEKLQCLGAQRLSICQEEAMANYDLLEALLDRVRFLSLHRKELFSGVDKDAIHQTAFAFFEVARSSMHKVENLFLVSGTLAKNLEGLDLRKIEERKSWVDRDFILVEKDIRSAQMYGRFISEQDPKYYRQHWLEPEDIHGTYGNHLLCLGNAFSNASYLEAQRVENIVGHMDTINRSDMSDKAWQSVFLNMKRGFIAEGRPSADAASKLLKMAEDAYATALNYTFY